VFPTGCRSWERKSQGLCAAAAAVIACVIGIGLSSGISAGELGANKADLMVDYLVPFVSEPGSPDGYLRVRGAMAEKALADARDAGLGFVRVQVTGYRPADFGDERNDLRRWQMDPPAFWSAMDRMFDALDRAHLRLVPTFVWNLRQFPSLANDPVGRFVRDPSSRSRQFLAQFLGDFIGRYKDRNTVLFYELTNEMNLEADLDLSVHCRRPAAPCVSDHFTTAEMIEFSRDLVALIKSLDPSRMVSSGYAAPRPAAVHLMQHPGFAPGGPDWTADSMDEFRRYLLIVHRPFDIISVHIYAGAEDNRFGRPPGHQYELVADAARAAKIAGKKLFIGEFGDQGATPFMRGLLDTVVREGVDYAAVWVWEFYQTSTYRTYDTDATRTNVEPGYSDDLIALMGTAGRALGHPPPSHDPTAAPRVVLTWPLPCAAVDKPLDLAAVASDGARPVKAVEFLLDGKLIATVSKPPYTVQFDPTGLAAKNTEIEARAIAASGTSAEFKSVVRLNGANGACPVHP
jgi:Bacterial Ig domain/Cellulase (glycosyl hydrolase family 5)